MAPKWCPKNHPQIPQKKAKKIPVKMAQKWLKNGPKMTQKWPKNDSKPPQELGDLALLLRAGCTKAQAMKLQLVTALAALAGASCSLLAEGSSQSSQCSQSGAGISSGILPFTAGGFIYLGTVSVIPEILRNSGPFPALLQLLALLAGLAMMLIIAIFE
ncbi:zinc transporter SLC39A7-like isoform X1 [Myiozetetes cayanensis]|uniref:zinc transporter SLC39A7-like isoform X1 n=1 Tax=Myiozetetes cayanensis TaxID=478635 RepID=UPI002160E114|nr:zinc transporter SLC39A7-like isoform X1 [Myiozetetes cayanensis]